MLELRIGEDGEIIFSGRLDAAEADKAQKFMESLTGTGVLDFRNLQYISSAGLGALIATHKRLMPGGGGLRLVNVNRHIHEIFKLSGLDQVFDVRAVAHD